MGLVLVEDKGKGPKIKQPEALSSFLNTPRTNIAFSPEYGQRHFYLIAQNLSEGLKDPKGRSETLSITREQAHIAGSILSASHETRVTVFVGSKEDLPLARKAFFASAPELKKQESRIDFKVGGYTGEVWAQDLGESVRRKTGGSEFLIGLGPGEQMMKRLRNFRQRGAPFKPEEGRIPTTRIPIIFEGGDITTTTLMGKKLVVVGPQTMELTRMHYRQDRGYSVSQTEIEAVIKKAFAADGVVFLDENGLLSKPKLAFHIDQAVFFPKDGTAVMLSPGSIKGKSKELSELKDALTRYRKQLQKQGFRIIELPVPESHMLQFQSYTNSIPITKPDGSTAVIMPGFGDAATEAKIKSIMRSNGMDVRFVRNTTYRYLGNTHCLTGALARSDEMPASHPRMRAIMPKLRDEVWRAA